uniref:SWIM-type domain-containing protein n=1 Tax=Rhizophagus irregularis (strain DAOM 181602 / DAOM 197198 / MUCL 43194) TaxID=747089 RepID=U9UTA8_RHIID
MDNVKSLAYSDNHDLYSFSSYSEPFNENLSLYSQLFNINSLSHKLLPSELFSKPSDLLAEPLFKLLSKLPSEPQPPFKQPSELILSKPLFEIPSGPLSEIPSEPLPEIPSELLPEIPFEPLPEAPSKLLPGLLSEPLSEPLPEPHCKVAPIVTLEMLKKKYPQHVFHKQDVYNTIYKLCQSNNHEKSSDSTSLLDTLFEKMSPSQQELYRRFSDIVLNDKTCKTNKFNMYLSVFMVKDNYGRFQNVANALDLNLQSNTLNDNFIEDVIDEPQTTLKSLLDGMDTSSIIVEVWKIRRIEGLSCKENLVALFSDGTYICTCMETITKGIVCRHFWRVMLYSSNARFHISLIPARWYKDEILMKLDVALENSPIIKAIESSSEATTVPLTVDFTLQTLQHLQGLFHNKENVQRIIP